MKWRGNIGERNMAMANENEMAKLNNICGMWRINGISVARNRRK